MARIGFVGPTYASQSLNADAQRCMNWYPEAIESGSGKSAAALYPSPGTKTFATLPEKPVRGELAINGRTFAVGGTKLCEVKADGSVRVLGTVVNDGQPASLAASTAQLMVVAGGSTYYYDLTSSTFGAIAGMLDTPKLCGYSDGYFIALLKNKFQISALLDVTSWDALDVAQVSVFPDDLVSMIVDHREIVFFGRTKSLSYYNSGNSDFPFEPVLNSYLEQGAASIWARDRADNSVLWQGQDERGDCMAWRAQGYTPARISNHAVEYAWSQYPKKNSDVISYAYQLNGHTFWQCYFPSGNATWVYDCATGMWHERGFWKNGRYEAQHSQCHAYCFGKHLVGDWQSGNIYEMSDALLDDTGALIRRMRRAPHISAEQQLIFHRELQLDLEVGVGTATGQGADPQIMLRWSDDGGHTWSKEHWMSAGNIGKYKARAVWRRLGRSRDRVYELAVTDPVQWRIIDAYLKADPGYGPTERLASNMRKMA